MTKENERLRSALKAAESIITAALRSQPEDDGACREHLLRNLRLVAGTVMPFAEAQRDFGNTNKTSKERKS